MTAVPAGLPPAAVDLETGPPPRLVAGLELVGEYRGSGSGEAPYLLRRPDGRMLTVSSMLYLLAGNIDGRRSLGEIADRLATQLERGISAEQVGYLITAKLQPLGVVSGHDGRHQPVPVLSMGLKGATVPRRIVKAVSASLSHLFWPPLIFPVIAGVVCFDAWLFIDHGVGRSLQQTASATGPMVVVYALLMMAATFHELGHAAAGHYGGAEPGRIGIGLYLIWPAFFSDMTDSYRLDRSGRLRADVGGVYFNAIFILVCAAAYWVSGYEPIIAAVVAQHLLVMSQFLPFLRLDGYYIVTDLVGVPDLFSKIRPVLRGLVPGRPVPPAIEELRPWARVVVTTWVVTTVSLLLLVLGWTAVHAPGVLTTAHDAAMRDGRSLVTAAGQGEVARAVLAGVHLAVLSVVPIGLTLTTLRLLRRVRRR